MKSLVYILPILIISGIIKRVVFYWYFDINILDYFDIDETVSILKENSILLIIGFVIWEIILRSSSIHYQNFIESEKGLARDIPIGIRITSITAFICVVLCLFIPNRVEIWYKIFYSILFVFILAFWLVFILSLPKRIKIIYFKEFIIFRIIFLGGIYILFLADFAYTDAKILKNSSIIKYYEYTYKSPTLEAIYRTSKEFIEIGKTKNYVFLHHKKSGESTILRREFIYEIKCSLNPM